MEASNGVVLRTLSSTVCFSGDRNRVTVDRSLKFRPTRRVQNLGLYKDKGHMEYYYYNNCVCGSTKMNEEKRWKGVSTKKKVKLLKGLAKDLSMFSELGFGLDLDRGSVDEEQEKMISEAAEVLLSQLRQLKAKEEDLKRKKEEKAMSKASKTTETTLGSESSSSSSESSDSECEREEVLDMACHRATTEAPVKLIEHDLPPASQATVDAISSTTCCNEDSTTSTSLSLFEETILSHGTIQNPSQRLSNVGNTSSTIEVNNNGYGNLGGSVSRSMKRVEVCMGGKCKKSGSSALMEEIKNAVGVEGAVVGCKCLGKCKNGPNVRVLNCDSSETVNVNGAIGTRSDSLWLGVGLEDVGKIVADYFGEELKVLGGLAASPAFMAASGVN